MRTALLTSAEIDRLFHVADAGEDGKQPGDEALIALGLLFPVAGFREVVPSEFLAAVAYPAYGDPTPGDLFRANLETLAIDDFLPHSADGRSGCPLCPVCRELKHRTTPFVFRADDAPDAEAESVHRQAAEAAGEPRPAPLPVETAEGEVAYL